MSGRATTISTSVGGKNVTLRGSNGTSARQAVFTTESVQDTGQLVRQLNELSQNVRASTTTVNSAPITSSVTIQSVVFTAGQTKNIEHGLGRNPLGWIVVRAQTNAWSGYESSLPSGLTRDRYLTIRSNSAGTYDFMIW